MKQTPVKYGIIAGLVLIAILYGIYAMDAQLYTNPILIFGLCVFIPFLAMTKATRQVREMTPDGLDKRTAIRTAFIVWILAMVIFHIFHHALFVYDENLTEILKERIREANGQKAAEAIGPPHPAASFQRFLFMLLPGFLFAYMIASFLRNKVS